MSFDIFISAFQDGKHRYYPRISLEKAFGSFCDMSDPTWWKVADSFAVIELDDTPQVSDFSVNRPPAEDHQFWPARLGAMRDTSSVIYWPGSGPVVTDESVKATLPPDMIKVLGPATVVASIEDIFRLLSES